MTAANLSVGNRVSQHLLLLFMVAISLALDGVAAVPVVPRDAHCSLQDGKSLGVTLIKVWLYFPGNKQETCEMQFT